MEAVAVNPWEDREDLGWPRAFVATARRVILSRRELFAETDPNRRLGGPLSFAVIALTTGSLLEVVAMLLLAPFVVRWWPAATSDPMADLLRDQLSLLPEWLLPFLGCQVAFLAIPLTIAYSVVLLSFWSLISHLALAVTGSLRSSPAGFRGTFAVVSYSTAGALAQIVPGLGDLIFLVVLFLSQVAGIEVIHGTTRRRAIVAALLPLLLFVGAVGSLAALQ